MNTLVLMTALIPTTGHADIIRFAASLPDSEVKVLLSGRSHEPYSADLRADALREELCSLTNVTIRVHHDDHAPQNPGDMDGFWEWWADTINTSYPDVETWSAVVASEPYGAHVADSLHARFIPYDISRSINPVKGQAVRDNLWEQWLQVIPPFRKHLQYSAVIFGQESVGKTTVSRAVSEALQAQWLMEYARPYLEEVGAEVTGEKMETIQRGQYALQESSHAVAPTPAVIMDTDLFSTVGYYRIWAGEAPAECVTLALRSPGDMYFILPDTVPFVEDQLRYGDGVRESSTGFWVDLLEEYGLPYMLVPSGSVEDKTRFIAERVREGFEEKTREVRVFERE